MGNWRTVQIIGTCGTDDVPKLRDFIDNRTMENKGPGSFGCLTYFGPSLCGIGLWPSEEISVRGNLSERDFDVQDVAEAISECLKVAPSLDARIHCGDERESKNCIATIVARDGKVETLPPMIDMLPDFTDGELAANMMKSLQR